MRKKEKREKGIEGRKERKSETTTQDHVIVEVSRELFQELHHHHQLRVDRINQIEPKLNPNGWMRFGRIKLSLTNMFH